MIKFLRKHKKEALAVFTVGLMIQFAVTIGPSGGNKRHETVAGTVAGKPIYQSEIESGRREWQALHRSVASARPNPQTGRYSSITESELGADVVPTIDEKPELFPLLVREARDAGMRVNRDEVESIMVNGYRAPLADADANREFVQQAVEDLLMVRDNMYRLLGNVKVSAPQREQVFAKALQTIQLKVVELSAADFATKVPAPTAQQVQEQFQKYANVAPGQPDRNNPFGFGYRLPDRVKVQYLTIDRGEVEKAVEATKTPYQWEVEGRLYYLKHRDEFLAPASQPTTAPSLATSQPTTGPAYKPFEQVRDDAIRAAREPLVEKLTFEVQNKLVSALSADWRTFSQKSATTSPTATESDYPSYNYLKRLADTVRSQTGVNVFVSDYGRDMSLQDLQALGGISQASDNIASGQGNSFIALAMDKARAYFNRADKGTPAALAQLMQPAPPLTDFKQNVYIFRLTDAHTAEAAPNLDVVRDKVEADLKRQAGYEMASAVAQDQFLPAAKNGTLSSVAMTLGKGVLTTDPFSADPINRRPPTIGASITLSPSGSIDFADEAFSMLTDYNATTNPNPVKLIRIPQDGKVYVAQLVKVSPQWDDRSFYSASLSAGAVMRAVLAADLRRDWFNADAITQRIGYKPAEDRKSNAGS